MGYFARGLGRHGLMALGLLVSTSSWAQFFSIPVLEPTQTDPIFRTLASALIFRPVEPASDLGRVWGLYLGPGAAAVDASEVNSVFTGSQLPFFPGADIQAGLGVSNGVVLEVGYLPAYTYNGTSFSKLGLGMKWNFNRNILKNLPFDLAVQSTYTTASLSFTQPIQGADVTVNYNSTIFSVNMLLSKRFLYLFEPFIGFGISNQTSSITSTGSVSIFGSSFPLGTQNYSGTTLSPWYQGGILLNLLFVGVAAQYDNMFGLNSFTGKVTIRI